MQKAIYVLEKNFTMLQITTFATQNVNFATITKI